MIIDCMEKCKSPSQSYQSLNYSWDMVYCIEDFINCIDIHKKDLKSPRNIGLMNFRYLLNDKDFNPAGVLKDYIYLEAHSFFKIAKKLKSNGVKMPEIPPYFDDLEKFRNNMPAHRNLEGKYKFPEDWIELQEKTSKLIPIKKLIKDIDVYFHCLCPK